MTDQEKYADKIAKLLAKAESTTPEEAEALYETAQKIMTKFAIDQAMIDAATGQKARTSADPIVSEEFVIVGIYRFALERLASFAMHANKLEVVKLSDPGWREVDGKVFKETVVLVGVGYQSDVNRARLIYTSLQLQALRAENAWWAKNKGLYVGAKRGGHFARRGFLYAFADGAWTKLSRAVREAMEEASTEHGEASVALVLRDRGEMVMDAFKKLFPNLTKGKVDKKDKGDMWARSNGYVAGQNADTGQPGFENKKKEALSS